MRWYRSACISMLQKIPHHTGALGQDLEGMPVGTLHGVPNLTYELLRHSFLEQVGHGVDEHHSGPLPKQRLLKASGTEGQIKSRFERMTGNATEPLTEP